MIKTNSWFFLFIILFLCIIIPQRNRFMLARIQRRRKEGNRTMPIEMLREYIGQDCTISLFNDIGGVQGRILAVEANWVKIEEKKRIRIINGDMIRDIAIAK